MDEVLIANSDIITGLLFLMTFTDSFIPLHYRKGETLHSPPQIHCKKTKPCWVFNYPTLCLVAQSCPTLCNPTDCSPPGSSVHGILQARILEWAACPPPGILPNPGIEPRSPAMQAVFLPSESPGKPFTHPF